MSNIISLILIITSIGLFFGYIDPTYDSMSPEGTPDEQLSIKELLAKKAEYDEALTNTKEFEKQKEATLTKFNDIPEANREAIAKLLPDHIDNVRLIIHVDEIAKNHQMRIRNFKASAVEETGTIGADSTPYGTLTFTFSTTASYGTFLSFMSDLERSLRLIDVTSISFASGENDAYDYDVAIKTYWLK